MTRSTTTNEEILANAWQSSADAHHITARKLTRCVDALTQIRDIARCSEGVEFYAMLADRALKEIDDVVP